MIPVLGSQPARDVSHKPGGRLPLLSARPAVTLATLKRAATSFGAWCTIGVNIFTARCYASAVLAMGLCLSVCVCVCHKSEFY